MEDKIVSAFNRWFRILVGAGFITTTFFHWDWASFIFGILFIIMGIRNVGCHGERYC
jgi:hypothetical protein